MNQQEFFPDGTLIEEWFYNVDEPRLQLLGKPYILTDYGIFDDGKIYTQAIQNLIDHIASEGGGVLIVPKGIYRTGAIFFKQGVHLYLQKQGVLLASDDVSDYPVLTTRIEGETCSYFSALINADSLNGFTIFGEGTIDGNGLKFWKAFWLRRAWNSECTNKDEQRPRLIYISNCRNVLVTGITLQNSPFWTNHIYKSQYVRYLKCRIFSPNEPVAAPSTDGIDIDACTEIHIKNCSFDVNDDAIALKGGKGPWANEAAENGANEKILIEDCIYGRAAACLTCGSESIHNKNILVRRIKAKGTNRLLWLKMRPDTPQFYEFIKIEDFEGDFLHFLYIQPWKQFYDLKGRKDIQMSYADNITIRNGNCTCKNYFNVKEDETQYRLSRFIFENLKIETKKNVCAEISIPFLTLNNVIVTV